MLEKIRRFLSRQPSSAPSVANNQARIVGVGNRIIQIIGAHGSSRPMPLTPVRFVDAPQDGGGVATHLEWRTRLATFTGRDAELNELQAWLDAPHALSFKIIHAEGGVGKTRLGAELSARAEVAERWQSGWVELQQLEASDRLQCDGQWLLLVDYPEHNPQRIASLAKAALAVASDAQAKVRVLLLCREGGSLSGALQSAGAGAYLAPALVLQPLAPDDNFQAFRSGLQKRSARVGAEPELKAAFAHWLGRHKLHNNPLFVNALALDVADGVRRADGSDWLTGIALLKALLAREGKRWAGAETGAGAPPGSVSDAVFWATLLGGLAPAIVNDVLVGLHQWHHNPSAPVHQALAAVGLETQAGITALQPDLLAAVFLTEWLQAPAHQSAAARCADDLARLLPAGQRAAQLLRINMLGYDQSVRLGLVMPGDLGALDRWLMGLCAGSQGLRDACYPALVATQVWRGLPGLTHHLASHAISAVASGLVDPSDLRRQAERARVLNNASIDLSETGDRAGALAPAREAVEIYRLLAEANSAAYEPHLARSLNNLANHLSKTGDRARALAPVREAVEIRRRLTEVNPAVYEPDLAMSLNNLASALSETGDPAGALTAAREAIEIRRRLAQANPTTYEPNLAVSLSNLASSLSQTGDRAGALAPAREAVEIRRRLAEVNLATYEPDLAASLNNLANHLSETGDRAGALAPIREAVEIWRRLAEVNPAAFEPELAMSLNNLATRLSETGDQVGALAPAREGVEILRRLAQVNPAAYKANLAMSLDILASLLGETDDWAGALELARDAVEIRRRLAGANPAAYEPDLAMSLHNMASFLSGTGDWAGALELAREAVEIRRRLAGANPAAYEPDLAMSLHNMASFLSGTGDWAGALEIARDAVEIYQRLAEANPAAYEPDLAMSLNKLANRLSGTGDRAGALAPAREAVEIYQRLAEANPAAYEPGLAMSLGTLMQVCAVADELPAAQAAGRECLVLFTRLAQRLPAVFESYRDQTAVFMNALESPSTPMAE